MLSLAYLKRSTVPLQFCYRRCVSKLISLPFDEFRHPDSLVSSSPSSTQPPTIILLHGFLGNRKNNRSAGRELSKILKGNVFIPDLRNHGKAFHSPRMNYKVLSNDISDFIKLLKVNKKVSENSDIYLLGHSMGGKLSMIFTLLNPKLIKGVISIDNIPYRNPNNSLAEFQKFHIALREIELCLEKYPNWTLNQLRSHLLKWVEPNQHIVDFYLTNLSHIQGILTPKIPIHILRDSIEDILEWRLEEYGDLDEYSKQENVPPLLIIRATKSVFVGRDLDKEEIDRWFPQWDTVDIESSHWIITEKRDEFINVVNSWIKKQSN